MKSSTELIQRTRASAEGGAALITTRQSAELCGVHASTVKRWCDAGDLACQHTTGGHRRIDLQTLLDFAARSGVNTDLDRFDRHAVDVWEASRAALDNDDLEPMVQLWNQWLMSDEPAYLTAAIFLLLRWGYPLEAILDEGVARLMCRIGEAWNAGRLGIGDEHRTTEQVIDVLHGLRLSFAPASQAAPIAVVGAAPGNRHHLGAFLVRLVLESRGWSVTYLGADVPADQLIAQQRRAGASLMCVSFCAPQVAADARRLARTLGLVRSEESPFQLVIGGGAFRNHEASFDDVFDGTVHVMDTLTELGAWLDHDQQQDHDAETSFSGGTG